MIWPPLCNGTTCADFQTWGMIPVEMERLKRTVICLAINEAQSFKKCDTAVKVCVCTNTHTHAGHYELLLATRFSIAVLFHPILMHLISLCVDWPFHTQTVLLDPHESKRDDREQDRDYVKKREKKMTVGGERKKNKSKRGRIERGGRDAVGHLFEHKYLRQRSRCRGTNYVESAQLCA